MVLDPRIANIDYSILELLAERVAVLRELDNAANSKQNVSSEAASQITATTHSTQSATGDVGAAVCTTEEPPANPGRLASHCLESVQSILERLGNAKESKASLSNLDWAALAEAVIPYLAGVTLQHGKKKVQIAYLGPEYSYSYSAACKFFGATDGFQAVQTIGAVFEEVIKGNSQFGVVPIENSTDGRIVDTLTKFIRTPVHICGEIQLPIHHNLLARCDRSEIREVHSKPQALSQCRGWLTEHLPNARWVEVASTALAAKIATEVPFAAAVASRDAGIALGLDIVAESIEDNKNNVTRFAIIGGSPAEPTGDDKTSLMFQVPHKPGALADAMLIFRDNQLNLSWIESFPLPGTANEYIFFVDVEGHISSPNVKRAVSEVEKLATRFNLLGSYPKGYAS